MLFRVAVFAFVVSLPMWAQANWDNGAVFTAKNTQGQAEAYLLPRWIDNSTHLLYGTGGFYLRTADGRNVLYASNAGNITLLGNLIFPDGSIQTTAAVQSNPTAGNISSLTIGAQQLLDAQTYSLDLRRTFPERSELRLIPHGNDHACGGELTLLNTDVYEDPINYELIVLCARHDQYGYLFQVQHGGDGLLRPISFDMMHGTPTIFFNTDGTASFLRGISTFGASVERGIAGNGTGMKHKRVPIVLSGNSTSQVNFAWDSQFADDQYSPNCSVVAADSLRVDRIASVTAQGLIVTVSNTGLGTQSGTLVCSAIHDF